MYNVEDQSTAKHCIIKASNKLFSFFEFIMSFAKCKSKVSKLKTLHFDINCEMLFKTNIYFVQCDLLRKFPSTTENKNMFLLSKIYAVLDTTILTIKQITFWRQLLVPGNYERHQGRIRKTIGMIWWLPITRKRFRMRRTCPNGLPSNTRHTDTICEQEKFMVFYQEIENIALNNMPTSGLQAHMKFIVYVVHISSTEKKNRWIANPRRICYSFLVF